MSRIPVVLTDFLEDVVCDMTGIAQGVLNLVTVVVLGLAVYATGLDTAPEGPAGQAGFAVAASNLAVAVRPGVCLTNDLLAGGQGTCVAAQGLDPADS